ncbi:hypothetical protein MMC18_004084 [Xylographa bjoerkii]|nr:hypothetical protein [Xylographa bjoerkii]
MNVFLSSKMKLSEIFQYDRVTSSSDSDLDVDGGEKQSDQLLEDASLYSVSMKQKARNGMISYLTCIVFILACGLAFAAGLNWEPNFAQRCLEHVSFYSPVLRVMDERYENVQFNGSLGFPSKYRGTPGPEVDEAWNNVEEGKSFISFEPHTRLLTLRSNRIVAMN